MPICQLRDDDWCERHQRFHRGATRGLALSDTARGELQRRAWDKALQEAPNLARQLINFGVALVEHVADKMAKRSQEEINGILTTHCQSCDFFDGLRCMHPHCGCSANNHRVFLNMLAWRSKKCPIGKWQ